MGTLLNLHDQDRVTWMMQSPKFREWLNSPKSRTLLINGNGEGSEVFSFTTFFSAKLLEYLGHVEPIISHNFFCSLHTDSRAKSIDDATGMVKSLVCQLLLRDVSWDLSFLTQNDVQKINSDHLGTTFMLFQNLVQQLPKGTFLFWVLDGISYYESSQWRQDFLEVIVGLLGMIRGCHDVVIKLLLTCTGRSSYVKNVLEKDDVLTMTDFIDGGRQGWSERTVQKTIGPDIESLKAAALASL